MLDEFDIIEQFFHADSHFSDTVKIGVGDDAAVFEVPIDYDNVVTVDTLVENVHFPIDADPEDLGYKSLAVSLSDIAAMGAKPTNALLVLVLPKADEVWLQAYAKGFFNLARQFSVDLIGGNITRGPLSMHVTVNGFVPKDQAILRSNAKVGDEIYVTGTLGDAGLALSLLQQKDLPPFLHQRFYRPTPRVEIGLALRGVANAMIDISDGLSADLSKLLADSKVGGRIEANRLPLSLEMREYCDEIIAWEYALTAGEDYELCFTVSKEKISELKKIMTAFPDQIHYIGEVTAEKELSIIDAKGQSILLKRAGYEHFSSQ